MSAESSKRLVHLAGKLIRHEDPEVRSLAGSVMVQFEADPNNPGKPTDNSGSDDRGLPPNYWFGFWDGMWVGQGRVGDKPK